MMQPARVAPGSSARPIFGSEIVMVSSAATAAPSTPPVSAETPDGRSTASTCSPRVRATFTASTSEAKPPASGRASPVPKSASIATLASARSGATASTAASGVSGDVTRRAPPANSRRFQLAAASAGSRSGSPTSTVSTSIPSARRCRATTKPSPPLFPAPASTTTGPAGRAACARRRIVGATSARPALSIRISPGTPRSSIVSRSRACISAAVSSGHTPAR